ncbi:MAG: hypothetical protein NC936_00915 [Candidatus Omnitrophica bacterium]|nr:hypothetical protein [Candidatus Omnitrophota bacterium]MCM8770417.1 hypothetical protein [Candidatus Omnitrophota bacterium]
MKIICALLIILSVICIVKNSYSFDTEFNDKLYQLKWVAYSPTNYSPYSGDYPTLSSIEEDLKLLLEAGFNGIITYSAHGIFADIPETAKRMGFQGVIMGVWDIFSQEELQAAINASSFVDGYCLGNENLGRRYEIEELDKVMSYVRQATQRPVTTSEEITDYANERVVKLGDWIFPNIHPFLFNTKDPKKAVNFVRHAYKILLRAAKGKPTLVKEVGFPTKGDIQANQKNQKIFFNLLEKTEVNFAYFEAFDQPWKMHLEIEPYWGLFDKNRRPKRFIAGKLKELNKYP